MELGVGALLGALLFGLLAWLLLPRLVALVLAGAQGVDARREKEGAYLRDLCAAGPASLRDEHLCACVLDSESPGWDCRVPFLAWSLAVQAARCAADPTLHKASLSFCTCVATLHGEIPRARGPDDRQDIARGYERCEALPDRPALPAIEGLGASR